MKYCLRLMLLFLLVSIGAYAQNVTVEGVVLDSNNEPLMGATVRVKELPSVGTITDFDGNFTLNVPEGGKTLLISFTGLKDQEVAVAPSVRVILREDSEVTALQEVVVTGMVNVDKRLSTGATTKIDASKAKLDGVADISRSLEGRAAGVSVQNVSGTFGTAPKIRVRGATSIYGNSRPLWVVDGVIMEDNIDVSSDDLASGNAETLISSAIAGVNADDIESFQILKDGSATSIYGARAMAGVIVVTTKKGQAGVSRLSYTGEFTTRLKPNYRDFNISNSQEQMGIYKEMDQKGWLQMSSVLSSGASGVYGKMYDLINTYLGNDKYGVGNYTNAMNDYLRTHEKINTDWFDELFSNSIMQNHAVSLSSGTDKAQFYVSLSAMNDPGWSMASDVERYTFNANGTYNISPTLSIKLLGQGSRRDQKAPGTLTQETDVVSGQVRRGFDINPYSFALNTSRTMDPDVFYKRNYAPFNVFHELENNYIDLTVTDVKFQGELTWKILKGWQVNALGAIRYSETVQKHHIKDRSNMAMAYRAGVAEGEGGENAIVRDSNPYLYKDRDDTTAVPETVLPQGGIFKGTYNSMKDMSFRASTTYSEVFNDIHIVNLFGGMDIQSTERQYNWYQGWGIQYDMGEMPAFDPKVFKQLKEEKGQYYGSANTNYRNVAFFGMGTYSYKGKYVLNGTLRYEGSNKMGKSRQSRWLPTWNLSGAWNAHEEDFFKDQSVLSHATLKASYSLTADAGPLNLSNALPIYNAYTLWRPYPNDIETGLILSDTQNENLTYEKKNEINIGTELSFLNGRIGVTADVYWRDQHDLIGQLNTTGIGGGGIMKYGNVASMSSKGFELSINTQNIVTRDFKWSTDFLFSKTSTKIKELDSDARMISLVAGTGFPWEGYPVRALFSIPFVGLNDEGLPTFLNENGDVTIADFYFQESDQDKLKFLKYEGPIDPTMYGSLGNLFNYKGIGLNVFVTYSFGNYVRLDPVFSVAYSDLTAMPREFSNRWVVSGDEKKTDIPVLASRRQYANVSNLSYAYTAYNYSTARVAKGDFIRLKEVSLSYDFPKKWTDPIKVNNLSLKLQATNLFLLYADKKLNGQDPEFFNSGGVATPMPKQFTLTLRFGL